MKTYKTLIFIIAVFTMLGAVSASIPEGGFKIGDITLKFPTPSDIFDTGEEALSNAQEIIDAERIRKFIVQQRMSEEMTMRYRAVCNQVSINFPNDDPVWMDDVFIALENAHEIPVRIIHYGDSQIEEDRLSSVLRGELQERFGGSGVGMVPATQTVATSAIGQTSEGGERYIVFGPEQMRLIDGHYGALGQTTVINGHMRVSFYPVNLKYTHNLTKQFDHITIMVEDVVGEMAVEVVTPSTTTNYTTGEGDNFIEISVPQGSSRATVTISGQGKVNGIMLDGNHNGVSLDNAAMRGCSGTVMTRIARKSIAQYYNHYNVPLIIMQYGGNTVPYIKGEKALESYCSQLETQIKYLRQVSPQSKILFIGPSDMSTKIDGRMETYPFLPRIVDALRDMCLHNEVAYWDLYKAMGGKNSMASWVNASPQLAGADYVHFTRMGADRAGAMLYQGMMLAYDYYTYRRGSHQDTDTVAIAQPIEVYIPQDSTIFQVLERDTIVNIISKDTIVAD